jgi:site-specific DNA-methyltransferase (adenine-specific)
MMQVQMMAIDAIKPYETNPRAISDAAIAAVAASIQAFGFRQPILVDAAGVIIAGHTRRLAAIKLGLAEAPVIVCQDLTPAQVKTLRIADNQTASISQWDDDLLSAELAALQADSFDLSALGFADDELAALLGDGAQSTTIDETPPPSVQETLQNLDNIRQQRSACSQATATDRDTERYLVVVFPTREAREKACSDLGLPTDERYVASSAVRIKRSLHAAVASGKAVSPPSKTGATG